MVFLELKLSMLTSFVLYLHGKFLKAVHHIFFISYITLIKAYSQQIFLTEWMEKDVELRTQSLSLKNGVKRECRQGECSRAWIVAAKVRLVERRILTLGYTGTQSSRWIKTGLSTRTRLDHKYS